MSAPEIVVVGSANVDHVVEISHRPAGGETILGSDIVLTAGGKGANQAVAASRLGGNVAFIGAVGKDSSAELLLHSLRAAGVDVQPVSRVAAPTGVAMIMLTPDGENSIIVAPGANSHVTPELVQQQVSLLGEASVVVAQLEIPIETVVEASRLATRARFVLNAAPPKHLPVGLLELADPLVVNESEARFLVRGTSVSGGRDLAVELVQMGARSVVVTMGAHGAFIADGHEVVHVRAMEVDAVDTTGAGDAFVGALALGLADGDPLRVAAHFAGRVAALAVTRRGAQDSYPGKADLPTERAKGFSRV